MSSDHFNFIMIEIPKIITLDLVRSLKKSANNISVDTAVTINGLIGLDLSDIEVTDVYEEDLFHIGEVSLKAKRAVSQFLEEAIDTVLLPRIGMDTRFGSIQTDKSFAYLEIGDKLYALTGDQTAYYSSKKNKSYNYFLAINLSKILEKESNKTT